MAHMMKIKRGGVANSLAHDDRSQENISNKEVDKEKSNLNVKLHSGSSWEKYKNIMDNEHVKCMKRNDVNTLCSWVVTAPKELNRAAANDWLMNCYNFLNNRYKKSDIDNIVSAVIHNDETTPHLHFKFVPLREDKKRPGNYKVSAKEVVNKTDLNTFHKDLDAFLEDKYLMKCTNGITEKNRNKTISELKNETLRQIEKQQDYIDRIEKRIPEMQSMLRDLDDGINSAYACIERLEKLEKKIEPINNQVKKLVLAELTSLKKDFTLTARKLKNNDMNAKRSYESVLEELEQTKALMKKQAAANLGKGLLPNEKKKSDDEHSL